MPDHDQPPRQRPRPGAVRITAGGTPVIHTVAWLALRTRGVHEGLTRDLHTWTRRHHPLTRSANATVRPRRPGPNWPPPGVEKATTA